MKLNQEELNIALYNKLSAEQDDYRDWLSSQSPAEILAHAYEYSVREDIVSIVEYLELLGEQAEALLNSNASITSIYADITQIEGDHMDIVRDCIETKAEDLLEESREKLRSLPVYSSTAAYAAAHGELEQYKASYRANVECKDAIEDVIANHYHDNRLDISCVKGILDRFGPDRTAFIIAGTIRKHGKDGRISSENQRWAAGAAASDSLDFGNDRQSYAYMAGKTHPGLIDLFASELRKEIATERKPSVLDKLRQEQSSVRAGPGGRQKEEQR